MSPKTSKNGHLPTSKPNDQTNGTGRAPTGLASIPCGCGGNLIYGQYDYTSYDENGRKIELCGVSGYKCPDCGLVVFPTDLVEDLERRIETYLRELSQ